MDRGVHSLQSAACGQCDGSQGDSWSLCALPGHGRVSADGQGK